MCHCTPFWQTERVVDGMERVWQNEVFLQNGQRWRVAGWLRVSGSRDARGKTASLWNPGPGAAHGWVGFYPASQLVHVDVGLLRQWSYRWGIPVLWPRSMLGTAFSSTFATYLICGVRLDGPDLLVSIHPPRCPVFTTGACDGSRSKTLIAAQPEYVRVKPNQRSQVSR